MTHIGRRYAWMLGLLVGCTGPDDGLTDDEAELCAQAEAHFDECELDPALVFPDSCDAEAAEVLLDASCEQLAEPGKADACNPFFWWTCFGGGSDTETRTGVAVKVHECGDFFGVVDCSADFSAGSCIQVTVEDLQGNVVASDLTSVMGSAGIWPLEPGDYVVQVLTRDGDIAPMVDGDPFASNDAESPAQFEVTVVEDEFPVIDVWMKQGVGEEQLRRCADLNVEVEGSCDGEPMALDDVEWSWFLSFDRVGDDPESAVDITRPFKFMGEVNRAFASDLPVGRYELNLHQMDIPSFLQRPNPDYADLLGRFDDGVVHTESFEVEPGDAGSVLVLDPLAVDRTCD